MLAPFACEGIHSRCEGNAPSVPGHLFPEKPRPAPCPEHPAHHRERGWEDGAIRAATGLRRGCSILPSAGKENSHSPHRPYSFIVPPFFSNSSSQASIRASPIVFDLRSSSGGLPQ